MAGGHEEHQAHIRHLWERLLSAADTNDWIEADRLFNEARSFAKINGMMFLDLHVIYARYLIERHEYEKCHRHLIFLRDLYVQVGVTDYSFLGIRGIPPLDAYLGLVKAYASARPEGATRRDLLETLLDALDAEGKAATRETLASLNAAGSDG